MFIVNRQRVDFQLLGVSPRFPQKKIRCSARSAARPAARLAAKLAASLAASLAARKVFDECITKNHPFLVAMKSEQNGLAASLAASLAT